MISSIYVKDFATKVASSRVKMILDAGHAPQFSQSEKVLLTATGFLVR